MNIINSELLTCIFTSMQSSFSVSWCPGGLFCIGQLQILINGHKMTSLEGGELNVNECENLYAEI